MAINRLRERIERIMWAAAMDLVTHILTTRKLFGRSARVVAAGVLAGAPFYLAYPAWLIVRGELRRAAVANDWPD